MSLTWSMYTEVMAPEWPCRVKRQHESSRRNTWDRDEQTVVPGISQVTLWPGNAFHHSSSTLAPTNPRHTHTHTQPTLSVWSWLPVTKRPAAAFRAVMGFWCAQGTVWVRRKATVSLLYMGDEEELPRPGVPKENGPSLLKAAVCTPASTHLQTPACPRPSDL